MVNDQTTQFLYRAVIISVCLITGAITIFLFITALALGDGEAIKIISAMLPLLQTLIGAMVATVSVTHVAGAYVARQMAQVHIAQVNAAAPAAAPAAEPAGASA